MREVKIVIIEDSEPYAQILQQTIREHPNFALDGWFENATEAIARIPAILPDVVLCDLGLPDKSGLEVINLLKKEIPSIQFMVLTISDEDDKIFTALSVGASGYLLKNTPTVEIISSIEDMVNGGAPMSTQIARKVIKYFQDNNVARINPYEKLLTRREKEVLDLLSKGFLYKQIAAQLFISIQTVKSHCHNIYDKLHVSTRTEAIREYYNLDF